MKKTLIIVVVIALLVVLSAWSSYNGLVVMKENATAMWQQVETQYQRRFDLIPNLVESVKGTMQQEQTVFTALADARTKYSGAQTVSEKAQAAGQVETAFGRLLVVMENYPVLKSTETVQNLMTQLEGTENRISVERQRYNETVRVYQTSIKRFPRSVLASLFGFDDLNYFDAAEGTDKAPVVDF